jgi:CheY-like chemotaxis protein
MAAVYIVDDNVPTSTALAFVFRTLEHEVRTYQSGVEMLAELLRHEIDPPALFIIDDDMPALEGMDLLRLLKAHEATAKIPTIMFTARQEPEIRRQALALGAADFWVKGSMSFEDICVRASRHLHQPLHAPQPTRDNSVALQ